MNKHIFYNRRENYHMRGIRKDYIFNLIPDRTNAILDIGCGNGNLAELLQTKGYRVVGVDISEKSLKEARRFLDDGFCFSVEEENWPKELMTQRFDLIIASEIIEHIFDPFAFLNKIKSLVSPNGKIIITTPNTLFWKNRFKMLLGRFQYEPEGLMDYGHIRFFTVDTIRNAFKKSGLTIIKERHFYPNLYKRGLDFIGEIFPGFFAYQMIFLLKPLDK